jgi:hypothetical protein
MSTSGVSPATSPVAIQARDRNYRMLRIHSFILTFAGWGAVVAGVLYLATLLTADARMLIADALTVAGLIVAGICLLAFAEFIQLAIHVEENTRNTA